MCISSSPQIKILCSPKSPNQKSYSIVLSVYMLLRGCHILVMVLDDARKSVGWNASTMMMVVNPEKKERTIKGD